MKKMYRVAMVMGLVAMSVSATHLEAAELQPPTDEIQTQIFVMNNYLTDVRVYVEDAKGKLYPLGRLSRGAAETFSVPQHVPEGQFRVKVFPSGELNTPYVDHIGVKTNALLPERDQFVRLWIESDLTRSIVEIARD